MKISSMFEFAFGKEVNFGNQINGLPYMTTLDFTKDVEGYGFAIRDGIDADLSNIESISPLLSLPQDWAHGVIEFKTENSGNAPEQTKVLNLLYQPLLYSISNLSSPLKEIVLWFPKSLNKNTGKVNIVIEEIKLNED